MTVSRSVRSVRLIPIAFDIIDIMLAQWAKLVVSLIFGLDIANLSKNMINHTMDACL